MRSTTQISINICKTKDTNLRIQSDNGIPALIDNPDGEISKKFISIAKNLKNL